MERNEVLKETALLYFSEALFSQAYEECPQLVDLAKKFGANKSEIDEVVTDYIEGRKPRGQNGANQGQNRLRVLKEG